MNPVLDTVHLLLVDDHAMFREGLARSIEREPGFRLVGQCESAAEALSAIEVVSQAIDVPQAITVLLDADLGSHRALEFVEAAKKAGFEGPILVLTAGVSGPEALQLMQAGIAGIIHKRHPTQVLFEAIRRVVSGGTWIEEEYVTSLLRSVDRTRAHGRAKLTERDRTVLRYILEGLANKDIGVQLHISEGAVKGSLQQLFEKLGVRTRAQLVKVALEQYKDQL